MTGEAKSKDSAGREVDIAALSADSYEELKRMARARLRSSGPLTLLDTSGLVGDMYQRLAQLHHIRLENRVQFLGYCSRIMRSIIVDLVRETKAKRRGAGVRPVELNTDILPALDLQEEPLRIDETLSDLAKLEPRLAQLVEMRYFGGYSEEEIAEVLSVTVRTVQRDWAKARTLLKAMLSGDG